MLIAGERHSRLVLAFQEIPIGHYHPQGSRGDQLHEVPDVAAEGLVAQEEDLGVLGPVEAGKQGKPAEEAEHRQITES